MPKILVIVGTTREGRSGRKVADWYLKEAQKSAPDVEFELLDVADLNLPLFNETTPPLYHQYSDTQNKLAATIAAADGYVFVTSEYNHSIPASLKNYIDHVSAEWNHKVAAYVGYGASGATRAIEHLIQVMAIMRVASTADHITVNAIWEALDENGTPKPGYVFGDISAQVKELVWWADALKAAR